eukprot:GHVU01166358.1.p2 GENE.GHVU01166358.1~~GHVU01166358.1.p2  ORF type:complete len:100 (+),score=0.48 GHVU01166358.1:655-954(+)
MRGGTPSGSTGSCLYFTGDALFARITNWRVIAGVVAASDRTVASVRWRLNSRSSSEVSVEAPPGMFMCFFTSPSLDIRECVRRFMAAFVPYSGKGTNVY